MKAATARLTGSDAVRQYAHDKYLTVARRRGQKTVTINAGVVHRALGLHNRIPLVCAALGSKKFLTEHNLRLAARTGPASGQSTTVEFTFEILDSPNRNIGALDPWETLRGIGKEVFASLGGGEEFLRQEREQFDAAMEKRERGNGGSS